MNNDRFIVHRLWIEGPEAWARVPRVGTFLIVLALSYSTGLGVAAIGGTASAYLLSPAFMLGSVGTAWVFTSIPPRARKVDRLYSDALNAFDDSPQVLASRIRVIFDVACDRRGHLALSATFFLLLVGAAYLAFFSYPTELLGLQFVSLRPASFAEEIYRVGGGVPGFVLVVIFAAQISIALGTAVWLMVGEIRVLPFLATRIPPPLPKRCAQSCEASPTFTYR